jgi:seryl-tRNA synthetase
MLFSKINSGYYTNTPEQQAIVKGYLEKTKMLNIRLNDLTQIINAITEHMLSTSDTIQNEIEQYNKQIKKKKESLEKQNKIINTGETVTNIRKEMVKYTEEKAKYTDNLLNLYSFLNIVTLGLLVYIYKAAGNE